MTLGSIPKNGLNLPVLSPLHSKWKVNWSGISFYLFKFLLSIDDVLGHYTEMVKNTKLRI